MEPICGILTWFLRGNACRLGLSYDQQSDRAARSIYTVECLIVFLFFSGQKLHLLLSSQCACYSAICFENKMRPGQEPTYVSNKRCHEQNRHTLVPSRVLICTICCNFNLGLRVNSEWREKHEKTSSFSGFRTGKTECVGQTLKADLFPGRTLLIHFAPQRDCPQR